MTLVTVPATPEAWSSGGAYCRRAPHGELDTLVPAYATTIHKSQGSEYPAVVIPLAMQHWTMLARNLLYTGVTRAKRLVVLIGQRKVIGIAVRGGSRRRYTKLDEWMRAPSQFGH